jgi:predicted dehydrogenase
MGVEHIRNLQLLAELDGGVRVVAIADPVAESRERAREVGGDRVALYSDHRALLDGGDVDAVVVATPNHSHARVLGDLWGSGKHLLIEKPLATTMTDARQMASAAAGHRGVVQVGMEYRFMPPVARLIDEVHGGTVGRVRMLSIREHRFPFLPKVGDWNRFARNTGGTLVEKCCHFFDLMRLIVRSEPVSVFASGAQDVNHLDERYDGAVPDILDNAFVVVDFADGVRAALDLCMFAEASRNQEEIGAVGDRGKIECFIPESTVTIGLRRGGHGPRMAHDAVERHEVPVDPRLLRAGHHHGATFFAHRAFVEAIRTHTAPVVTVEDGLMAVAIGVAAERSVAERRVVQMAQVLEG